jgi:hypothetical protein
MALVHDAMEKGKEQANRPASGRSLILRSLRRSSHCSGFKFETAEPRGVSALKPQGRHSYKAILSFRATCSSSLAWPELCTPGP